MKRKNIEIKFGKNFAKEMSGIIEKPGLLDSYADHTIFIENPAVLASILTEKRLELLSALQKNHRLTVNDLARHLKRKREAVSRDIKVLKFHGFIITSKNGKNVIPSTEIEKIVIPIKA